MYVCILQVRSFNYKPAQNTQCSKFEMDALLLLAAHSNRYAG